MEPNHVLHPYLRSNPPLLQLPDSRNLLLLLHRRRSLASSDVHDVLVSPKGWKYTRPTGGGEAKVQITLATQD